MAMLKRILETLDGLDETMAKLYKKGEDGKFHLDVEEETSGDGLKSALQKERKAREDAEKALKEKERKEAEAKEQQEREAAEKRGEYDKLRAQDLEALKKEREAREALESRLRNGAIERAALEALTASGAIPKALLPHVLPNLEAVPDGDSFKVTVKANPGQSLTDYVAGLKADMPWGFNGSGASGSGAAAGGGTGGGTKEPPKTAGEAAQQAWSDIK